MYPETTAIIRDTIKRRYELIPYIYSLSLESHLTANPPQRWTGWGYESDPEVWASRTLKDGETQYWLGDSLLICGVYEPNVSIARVYLPKGEEYISLNAPYQHLHGGQWVDIESKWDDSIPVLAKVGGAIPVGRPCQVLSAGEKENPAMLPPDDYRAVEIFPPRGSSQGKTYKNLWYEDDGVSPFTTKISEFNITYDCTDTEVHIQYWELLKGDFIPPWDSIEIILPVSDDRDVTLNGEKMDFLHKDKRSRKIFKSHSPQVRPPIPKAMK